MTDEDHPNGWNMFRRREEEELWCAVPAEAAVPRFLFSGEWHFGGHHRDPGSAGGFQRGPARHAARTSGFYLFQRVQASA